MYDLAIQKLSELQKIDSDNSPQAQLQRMLQPHSGQFSKLVSELLKLEPFSQVRLSGIFTGNGYGHFDMFFDDWCRRQLRTKSPAEILDRVVEDIESNTVRIFHVIEVKGVALAASEQISSNIRLCVPTDIPKLTERMDLIVKKAMRFEENCPAFLVYEYDMSPAYAFGSTSGQLPMYPNEAKLDRMRHEEIKDVRRSLLLASTEAVEFGQSFTCVDQESVFSRMANFSGAWERGPAPRPQSLDLSEVKKIFSTLTSLSIPQLKVSIDRLGTARSELSHVDKAIDYGIATEVILLANDANPKADITKKITSRSGKLLPNNLLAKTTAKTLYQARCDAAHSGELKPKNGGHYNFAEFDDLIRNILLKIVSDGKLPVW